MWLSALDAAWRVLVAGLLLGAGLPILFALGVPATLITLELTAQALVTPARIAAMRRLGGGACLRAACDILSSVPPSRRLGGEGHPLHDPCAIAWLVRFSATLLTRIAAIRLTRTPAIHHDPDGCRWARLAGGAGTRGAGAAGADTWV